MIRSSKLRLSPKIIFTCFLTLFSFRNAIAGMTFPEMVNIAVSDAQTRYEHMGKKVRNETLACCFTWYCCIGCCFGCAAWTHAMSATDLKTDLDELLTFQNQLQTYSGSESYTDHNQEDMTALWKQLQHRYSPSYPHEEIVFKGKPKKPLTFRVPDGKENDASILFSNPDLRNVLLTKRYNMEAADLRQRLFAEHTMKTNAGMRPQSVAFLCEMFFHLQPAQPVAAAFAEKHD